MSDKKNKMKAIFDKDNKSPSDINLLKDLIKLISLLDKEIKIIYILYLSRYTLEDISEKTMLGIYLTAIIRKKYFSTQNILKLQKVIK